MVQNHDIKSYFTTVINGQNYVFRHIDSSLNVERRLIGNFKFRKFAIKAKNARNILVAITSLVERTAL